VRSGRSAWLLVVLVGLSSSPRADVDVSEYRASGAVRSQRESARLKQEFEQRRAEEAAKARQAEAESARRLAEEAARRAARPWPVRLTEARCTLCHAAANYEATSHALPGWIAVILRMRYFNLAPLDWEEAWTISRHLSETRPADALIALFEWSAAGAMIAGPFLLYFWTTRRQRRFRKKES
jgi:hypothetical protein